MRWKAIKNRPLQFVRHYVDLASAPPLTLVGIAGVGVGAIGLATALFLSCCSKSEELAPSSSMTESASSQRQNKSREASNTAQYLAADGGAEHTPAAAPSPAPSPTWNAWAEQSAYEPVKWIKVGGRYRFAIDLALFAYKRIGQETFHQPISGDLSEVINRSTEPTARVTILFLPDPAFFNAPSDVDRSKEITLDLDKIRRAERTPIVEPADAFKELKNGNRDFVISSNDTSRDGRAIFPLVAKDQTDLKGWAHVGVSVWITKDPDGGETPVDEFSVPVCVADSEEHEQQLCSQQPPNQPVFRGLRAATEQGPAPDAALHFVDLGSAPVFGIFHRNDRPNSEFKVWAIDESFPDLVQHLEDLQAQYSNTVGTDGLSGEELEQQLRNEGASMYNALFRPESGGAQAARREFEAFAVPDLTTQPNADTTPKSIFVRMVGGNPPVNLLPINLLALPIGPNRSELLGLHFRIEQPLEVQSYLPSSTCISSWMAVMPDADTATNNGLGGLRDDLNKWPIEFQSTKVEDDSDMKKFRCFVKRTNAEHATALVIMSHQGNNAVWFKSNKTLTSDDVQVKFDEPSLVILDGCDTAKPESWGFIGKFNRKGAMTTIATSTEISPALAGDFVTCFVQSVAKGTRDVGKAYWQSLLCLENVNIDHPAWGSRALTFLLLGNPNLQLCSPINSPPILGACQ